jgi:hypothetical protein
MRVAQVPDCLEGLQKAGAETGQNLDCLTPPKTSEFPAIWKNRIWACCGVNRTIVTVETEPELPPGHMRFPIGRKSPRHSRDAAFIVGTAFQGGKAKRNCFPLQLL